MIDDKIGTKVGRLTIISKQKGKSYLCRCDCGNDIILPNHLIGHKNKSCGCLKNNVKIAFEERHKNSKLSPHLPSAKMVWKGYSRNNSVYKMNITFEDFYKLSQMNCYYCGIKPSNSLNTYRGQRKMGVNISDITFDNATFIYNGLDRIDSTKDHTIDNVVPCCKQCNWAKRNFTQEEFLDWITRLHNHQKGKL